MGELILPSVQRFEWKLINFTREMLTDVRNNYSLETKTFEVSIGDEKHIWEMELSVDPRFKLSLDVLFAETDLDESRPKDSPLMDIELSGYFATRSGQIPAFETIKTCDEIDFLSIDIDNVFTPEDYYTATLCLELKVLPSQLQSEEPNSLPIFDKFEELLSSKSFCDLKFVTSDLKEIPAHKFIVAANSPVLKRMLESMHEIVLEDIDAKTMEKVLSFMYTQKADIGEDTPKLIHAAVKYDIDRLKRLCVDDITVDNVLEIFLIADQLNEKKLLEYCGVFTRIYYEELKGHEEWKKFDDKQLESMCEFLNFEDQIHYFATYLSANKINPYFTASSYSY